MSNFVQTFKAGQAGKNLGLTTGIVALDLAINGLQKKTSIGLAAAPKVGKTTLADYAFVISPYLEAIKKGTLDNICWKYFSYEIDRVSKEFKFAAFFMAYDLQVYNFVYKDTVYPMNQDYLMGKQLHKNADGTTEQILITEEHNDMLKSIYLDRIVPMFGEYDDSGKKVREGKIHVIEEPENPTGLYKYMLDYAKQNGTFHYETYHIAGDNGTRERKERISGYTENNPDLYSIFVTDHIRKLRMERGFNLKQNMDKYLEYTTYLRNICRFTYVNICHSGRQLANVERMKFAKEYIYPTADDVKDTGNLAEESTILLTMFNPNDEKYMLDKHFGVDLVADGTRCYPNYRSIHIAESRYTPSPAHLQTNMLGGINTFTPLNY